MLVVAVQWILTIIVFGIDNFAILQATTGFFKLAEGCLYYVFIEGSSNQATLEKKVPGIISTAYYSNWISSAKTIGRFFAKILSATIPFIDYFMIASTKKQNLNGMLAETLAVLK